YPWSRCFWFLWLRLAAPPRREPAWRVGTRSRPPSGAAAAAAGPAARRGPGGRPPGGPPPNPPPRGPWDRGASPPPPGARARRSSERRPQERHGVARFHQRDNFDDAPKARIHDHPNFFTGLIDRANGVGLSLTDRATERLKPGRAHDRGDLVGRQYHPLARI